MSRLKKSQAYQTLEVDGDATTSEIRRAYLRLARDWHPDKCKDKAQIPAYEAKFKEVSAAFQRLTDEAEMSDEDEDIYEDDYGDEGHSYGGMDFFSFFNFMRRNSSEQGSNPFEQYYEDDDEDESADFYRYMHFHGGGGGGGSRSKNHPTESVGSMQWETRTEEERRQWREESRANKEAARQHRYRRQVRKEAAKAAKSAKQTLTPEEIELQRIALDKKVEEVAAKNFLKRQKAKEVKQQAKAQAEKLAVEEEEEERKRQIRMTRLLKKREVERKKEEERERQRVREEARQQREHEREKNARKAEAAAAKQRAKRREQETREQVEEAQKKKMLKEQQKKKKKAKKLEKKRALKKLRQEEEEQRVLQQQISTAAEEKASSTPTGLWACSVCTLVNGVNFYVCSACETPFADSCVRSKKEGEAVEADEVEDEEEEVEVGTAEPATSLGDAWSCTICTLQNESTATECLACDFPRGAAIAPAKKKLHQATKKTTKKKKAAASTNIAAALDVTCGDKGHLLRKNLLIKSGKKGGKSTGSQKKGEWGKSKTICTYYATKGHCKLGDACRFLHEAVGMEMYDPSHFDDETCQKLESWVTAKRTRNYDVADRLRRELNALGVNPDILEFHASGNVDASGNISDKKQVLQHLVAGIKANGGSLTSGDLGKFTKGRYKLLPSSKEFLALHSDVIIKKGIGSNGQFVLSLVAKEGNQESQEETRQRNRSNKNNHNHMSYTSDEASVNMPTKWNERHFDSSSCPSTYVCALCQQLGHWMFACPTVKYVGCGDVHYSARNILRDHREEWNDYLRSHKLYNNIGGDPRRHPMFVIENFCSALGYDLLSSKGGSKGSSKGSSSKGSSKASGKAASASAPRVKKKKTLEQKQAEFLRDQKMPSSPMSAVRSVVKSVPVTAVTSASSLDPMLPPAISRTSFQPMLPEYQPQMYTPAPASTLLAPTPAPAPRALAPRALPAPPAPAPSSSPPSPKKVPAAKLPARSAPSRKPNPRTSQKSAFVFACAKSTQDECFDLMLFGGTKTLLNDKTRRCVDDIQYGTPMFLLNMQTDTVYGPFFAESGMQFNHDPSAWGTRTVHGQRESAYPCQVCVDISEWEAYDNPSVRFKKSDPTNRALRGTRGGDWINEQIHRELVEQLGVDFPEFD